ncbi:MAG: hypothetical protein N3A54_07285, partial [Patescibacteria group bacterium]|nr:hypothetical protein [Patescibacteria group bacterium]
MEIPKFSPKDYQEAFARVLGNGSIEGVESYIPQIAGVRQDRDRARIKEDLEKAERQLRSYAFFNVEYGNDGRPVMNRNINHEPALLRELQDTLEKVARENRIRVLCPFVDELTAADNVRYAIGCVGRENVLAIKAGVGDHDRGMQAIDRIQNFGGEVIYQTDILERVDWKRLRKLFGIYSPRQPNETTEAYKNRVRQEIREPLSGSKGLTMLAGILELHQRDKIARQQREQGEAFNAHDILEDYVWIVFHDTDINNPEEYRALEHLAFVLAHESEHPNIFRAAQIARGGAGRNNEAVMNAANYLANMRKEHSRLLGITLQSLMWPLTGERMMRWGELKQMNWSNRMGIETWWNVWN